MLRSFQDIHWDTFAVNGGSILLTDDEDSQESSVWKYGVVGLEVRVHELINMNQGQIRRLTYLHKRLSW